MVTDVHHSFCRFCVAACGVVIRVEDGHVVEVRGDPDHPISHGYVCTKGRSMGKFHHHDRRLDHFLVGRGDERTKVAPAAALDDLAKQLRRILLASPPDATAFYLGTASFYDNAGFAAIYSLARALCTRSLYLTITVDTVSKPVISRLMTGGFPGLLTAQIDDDNAGLVVFLGSNPVVSHGHDWGMSDPVNRIRNLQSHGEVWVVDPRRTETARLADRHLAIRPGTDHALLGYLVREVLRDGADTAYVSTHTRNVEDLRRAVEPFDLTEATRLTGLDSQDLTDLLNSIRRNGRVAGLSGTGVSMTPGAAVAEWFLWALHAITGSFERPGGLWFNPGFFDQSDQKPFNPRLEPARGAPSRPELPVWMGRPCASLVDEIEAGNVRALFVMGGNPAIALPEHKRLMAALRSLEVLVVADVVTNEMTDLATHVVPCAGQLERSDVNIPGGPAVFGQHTSAVFAPSGDRKAMWWFLAQLGNRLDVEVFGPSIDPDTATDDDVLSVARSGARADLEALKRSPHGVLDSGPLLGWVEANVLAQGRWDLAPKPLIQRLSQLEDTDGLVLIPRRQGRKVNSTLRDVQGASGKQDQPRVFLNEDDATLAGVRDGDQVKVTSANGSLVGTAAIDAGLRRGAVSIPQGYLEANICELTSGREDSVDPLTGMVFQSAVAVTLEAVVGA